MSAAEARPLLVFLNEVAGGATPAQTEATV